MVDKGRPEGLVQIECNPQADKAILLIILCQHRKAETQQLSSIRLQHLVGGQSAPLMRA